MKNLRNHVQLIGNLGQDVELKEFESGKKIASFSIAINEYFTSNGQRTEKTEWHNIVGWGNIAEKMTDTLGKGDQVLIQGSLSNRRYEDNSGTTRYITEIIAGDFVKIGKKQ